MCKGHEAEMMFPVKFDLQLFAEEGTAAEATVAEPVASENASLEEVLQAETPVTAESSENPILAYLEQTGKYVKPSEVVAQDIVEELPPQEPEPEIPVTPDFEAVMKQHGLNFKDPEAFANSYKSLQSVFTHKTEEIKQLTQLQQQQQAQLTEFIASVKATQAPPQEGAGDATAQEIQSEILSDPDLLDKFYADPAGVIKQITEVIANQQMQEALAPVMEFKSQLEAERQQMQAERQEIAMNQQIDTSIARFEAEHSDFEQYKEAMSGIIAALPEGMDMDAMLTLAYSAVKGQQAPQPSLEEQLNDPEFLVKMAGNEKLREVILKEHMATLNQTTKDVPPILGPKSGGHAPVTEPEQLKTFKDSKRAFLNMMGVSPQ